MAKTKERYSFNIRHEGTEVSISTNTDKPQAFDALLRSIVVAYRTKPAALARIVEDINQYNAIIQSGNKKIDQEPLNSYDFYSELMTS